jgi:type VI secretion system protein ImpC
MPQKRRAEVHLDVNLGRESRREAPAGESPFCVAILGDFSARASRGIVESGRALARRPPLRVDRDNLDAVMASLAPELRFSLSVGRAESATLMLHFRELADFHPDRLFARLPIFESLRTLRARLADPATADAAVRELAGADRATPGPPAQAQENLLDEILAQAAPPSAEDALSGDLGALVRRLVAPHVIPARDRRAAELLMQVDAVAGALMRALLHDARFQALEARWRAVDLLTRRIETGPALQLHLIDVSADELSADLPPDGDFEKSGLYRLLVESTVGTPGAQRWAVLVGDCYFGPDADDVQLLAQLGALASLAGAPWLAGADPSLAGCESFAATPDPDDWTLPIGSAWPALRAVPLATHLGLAAPRFLLRLPYGAESEPCEAFDFEEMPGPPEHERYLWGNPALICALLLAESFTHSGWALRPGVRLEVGRLPLHVYRQADGATAVTPCAEVVMSERAADRLLERGLMPLATLKETDVVRLVRFQSLADPPAPLAGRWAVGG